MSAAAPHGTWWSDDEIDLIVADYFAMLRKDILGEPYKKAEHNRALRGFVERSRGSIEYKHQNISAVLQELGEPWIGGYKPAGNYQRALVDGILRYLTALGDAAILPERSGLSLPYPADSRLSLEAPPALSPQPSDPDDRAGLQRLVRKFDPAARDARNRELGRMGEELVFGFERNRLAGAGRDDLARKVKWVSEEEGDGAGYDILSFGETGDERLLEVKTTGGGRLLPFWLSENERLLSTERPEAFRIFRLYEFRLAPKAFEIAPPLEDALVLSPTNWRASFGAPAAAAGASVVPR